jgi:hypothetical protein
MQAEPPDDAWNAPALAFALAAGLCLLARRRWGGNGPLRWATINPWEGGMALAGLASFLLSFPIAFVPLRRVIPGLAALRAPGRFNVVTSLAVVVFAARGLDEALPAAGIRRRAVGALLALALAGELAPAALATRPLRDEAEFPAAYHHLRASARPGAVLELPRLKPAREVIYMYYSTLHWRPIANGYSGYQPASDEELRQRIPLLPDVAGLELLRQRDIGFLVVHTAGLDGRELRRQLPAWERRYLAAGVEKDFDDGDDRVYRLSR